MRTANRPSGPFRERLYFEAPEIDDICRDALKAAGCLPVTPKEIDVERFVEKHFRCECGFEDLPEGVMGFTAFDKKGKVVSIRVQSSLEDGSKTGIHRVRSTWSHEAGHGLLHAILFIEVPGSPTLFQCADSNVSDNKILCRNFDIRPVGARYDGRWWEWQANRCIGGLLLPRSLVRESLAALIDTSPVTQKPSLSAARREQALEVVSSLFNVSAAVAKIRLEEIFPSDDSKQITF